MEEREPKVQSFLTSRRCLPAFCQSLLQDFCRQIFPIALSQASARGKRSAPHQPALAEKSGEAKPGEFSGLPGFNLCRASLKLSPSFGLKPLRLFAPLPRLNRGVINRI